MQNSSLRTRSAWWRRRYVTTPAEGRSGHPAGNLRVVTTSANGGSGRTIENLRVVAKTLLVMKLTIILLTFGLVHAYARTTGQTITISGSDLKLENVFSIVEQQTGFVVFATMDVLKESKPVTINVKEMPLDDFMNLTLRNQDLTYKISNQTILISKKAVTSEGLKPRLSLPTVTRPPITGLVRDSTGAPLSGATVYNKRTKKSVQTNAKGEFEIEGEEGDVLQLSFIGFENQSLRASGGNVFAVMKVSDSPLDEIQIIAYGQASKRFSTGNVASVKAEDIEKQPVNNPLYALQGRVSGVTVTPTSGIAGSPVTVQIRGKNSYSSFSKNEPLYVIDGLPITNTLPAITTGNGAPLGNGISPLNYINSNDIESISVLKDADATSIYGSRGANGAILITTKKGKSGATSFDLNVQNGISQVPKKLTMMNTEQFIAMRKEALFNDGRLARLDNPAFALVYPDLMVWDQHKYTDWQEEMIGGNGAFSDMQASLSGGSELLQYRIGANHHRETTVFPGKNDDNKGAASMTLTGKSSNKKLQVTVSASYMYNKANLPKIDFTERALTTEPNSPDAYNSDGTINWAIYPEVGASSTWQLPPYSAQLLQQYEITINNLSTSGSVNYQLGPLKFTASFGYNEVRGNSFQASPSSSRQPLSSSISALRTAEFNDNLVRNLSVEPQISYSKQIFGGKLEILAGGSYQSMTTNANHLSLYDFINDALLKNKAAAVSVRGVNNSTSEFKYSAIFARVNYNLQDKYLINLSARRDGSSRFGPGHQFGNFGSIGAGWIFSEENFIKNNVNVLSYGKLRFSYGTSGNDGIGDYKYLEQYQRAGYGPYQGTAGYLSMGLFNEDFHWETTRKMEFGLETGFFSDRLLISTVYFRNRSDDQLIDYNKPSIAGPGSLIVNRPALIQNSGFELELNTINLKTGNFAWSSSFNFTILRNKLLKYPGVENTPDYQSGIGQPFWGWIDVYRSAGVDPVTGLYQFLDVDGNIVANPATNEPLKHGKDIRLTIAPKFQGGFGNTLTYKGVSLDFFFQFIKQKGVNPLFQLAFPGVGGTNQLEEVFGKQWKKTGDDAELMKFTTRSVEQFGFYRQSDEGYVDASFIRLKNVALSYSLPAQWRNKLHMKNMRVYLQGQNLITITDYKGLDPETQSLTSLPPLRTITAGFQIAL